MKFLLAALLCLFAFAVTASLAEEEVAVPASLEPVSFMSVSSLEIHAKRGSTIRVSPTSGPKGTTISVTYTAGSATQTWVGVFPSGSYYTNLFKWVTAASGSVTFPTSGLTAGAYNIYLVVNGKIDATATYTVTGGGGDGGDGGDGSDGSDGGDGGSGDAATWLTEHNNRRSGIVPLLSWSNKLATSAQKWAQTMASSCNMHHSGTTGLGENIAYGYGSIAEVMRAWVESEKPNYNAGQCNGVCGHYTQVMWKSTNLVGCGKANCANGTPMYACQYIRPGNCNGYNFMMDNSPCPLFDDSSL